MDIEALAAALMAFDAASIARAEPDGRGVDLAKVARELVAVLHAAREVVRQAP